MTPEQKIQSFDALVRILATKRQAQKRIVHCDGVFDLLHVGHVRHFAEAKKLGDVLVVTLTPDRFVKQGMGRLAFSQDLRAEFVASLAYVDYVAINDWPTAVDTIHLLRPNVFVKGSEFRNWNDTSGQVAREREAVHAVGGEMAFTDDPTFSSPALINQHVAQFPENVRAYLTDFARRYEAQDVLAPLRAAERMRVLLVGETIIDEYAFCEAIGKSGKEPVLAALYQSSERHGGGVLACANHAANFSDSVDVLTFLGEGGDQEAFVRGCLRPNVTPILIEKKGSPTIVKKRYVERHLGQKLFEEYIMNDQPMTGEEDEELCRLLHEILPRYDVVIVTDYGHGMLSPAAIDVLCHDASFLAVNTQSNAGNHGFNLISRYPRADYVCLAQREFALETQNRRLSPEAMIRHVAERTSCKHVMMTQSKFGCTVYAAPNEFKQVPALAVQVVDRVGAGDAVLCVSALCVAAGADAELVGFVGNVVGAEAVTIMGNQKSIERIPLYRQIECLLKAHATKQKGRLKVAG